MKIFQLKMSFSSTIYTALKTVLLLICLLFCFFNLSAQKESNVKLKIEAGLLWDSFHGEIYFSGTFLNIEPKLKASKNTVLGLRMGVALNTQAIKNSDPLKFFIDKNLGSNNVAISVMPTSDYYFSKSKFRPYVGLGVGYYLLTTSKEVFIKGNSLVSNELSVTNKIGYLFRGGFDLSKFIIGLEFNYVPIANVTMENGQRIGTISNNNVALSIGYMFGNGSK